MTGGNDRAFTTRDSEYCQPADSEDDNERTQVCVCVCV